MSDCKKVPLDAQFAEAASASSKVSPLPRTLLCLVQTNWKAIYIAGIVSFLAAVENTVTGMAEWPYMHQIDNEATSSFFGIASSISKWGHVVFSILFSFWTYKTQTVRWETT